MAARKTGSLPLSLDSPVTIQETETVKGERGKTMADVKVTFRSSPDIIFRTIQSKSGRWRVLYLILPDEERRLTWPVPADARWLPQPTETNQDNAGNAPKQVGKLRQGNIAAVGNPSKNAKTLVFYCAAETRVPVEGIVAQYTKQYGVSVQMQYGGSATLLSHMEVSEMGDLYLATDDSYIDLAHERGLVEERIPVAAIRPVLAVRKGNPKNIETIQDLLRDDVRLALGNPEQAAIGHETRKLLEASGLWKDVRPRVMVFKPTVSEVANDVRIGSVDVGVIWDTTAARFLDLEAVRAEEFDRDTSQITIAVMKSSESPTAALKFARFLAARDRGLTHFAEMGYEPVDGDIWEQKPEITFFAGYVTRRALEPILKKFQEREGVIVNTIFNDSGALTAMMRAIWQDRPGEFPDIYVACDVSCLETVQKVFAEGVHVSNTDIVIVTQAGNPKLIEGLEDLTRPGMRIVVGHPGQCTIGILTRRLLESSGLYEKVKPNIWAETQLPAMLVPQVIVGDADAVLAYATDTVAEAEKLHVVPIDSPLAVATQPFSIARASDFKYLGQRLFATIEQSRDAFTSAGFKWQLSPGAARVWENMADGPAVEAPKE
jgi:molybdenum ABC transporter molybdate-binding protein